MIGGSTNARLPESSSRVVTCVNLANGNISRAEPLLEATSEPAIASSQNMIAVCGGSPNGIPTPTCQVYSTREMTYVLCFLHNFSFYHRILNRAAKIYVKLDPLLPKLNSLFLLS